LQAHPCRGSLDKVFAWRTGRQPILPPTTPNSKTGPSQLRYFPSPPIVPPLSLILNQVLNLANLCSDPRFAILTALILIASYAVAMTVSSLDRVLAFVGSTGSTTISFILPGVFYHRMTRPGGLLPRTPEDAAKDDDEDSSIHSLTNGDAQESVHSAVSEDSIVNKRRLRRREIRRKTALGLMVYGFVIMAVCLTVNIVVGGGGH